MFRGVFIIYGNLKVYNNTTPAIPRTTWTWTGIGKGTGTGRGRGTTSKKQLNCYGSVFYRIRGWG